MNTMAHTKRLAECLSECDLAGVYMGLTGQLGAGKTTLVRCLLRQLGYQGVVHSPTYTLVQSYDQLQPVVFHCDLYRIQHPSELYDIGIDSYFSDTALLLIEWPEHGVGVLPEADVTCVLVCTATGRDAMLTAATVTGKKILAHLQQRWQS